MVQERSPLFQNNSSFSGSLFSRSRSSTHVGCLALARALLREPAVLVLDEATSAVDNETEAAIQRSLRVATAHCTAVVVAHRLSTVRHAHRIHVLEQGRVVESGTHDDLLALDGTYAALWRVQTGDADEADLMA